MGFGPFVLLSIFYAFIGVRVVAQLVRRRATIFDRQFTMADRAMVDQAAFFVLIPISVALHEMGHALVIWWLDGTVGGWGYYLFAGYVSYDPTLFSQADRMLVAFAGTFVNILLAAAAVGLVFLRQPPLRAAFNELLLQFAILSIVNALVFYPALDLVSGLNGDWTQIYRGGVPELAAVILVIHIGILATGWLALRSDRVGARVATLTDAPAGTRRRSLGGVRTVNEIDRATGRDKGLADAAARVASGWPIPVETVLQRRGTGTLVMLAWESAGAVRSVILWAPSSGDLEISGGLATAGNPPVRRRIGQTAGSSDPDRITLSLRLAMETVEGWETVQNQPLASPSS